MSERRIIDPAFRQLAGADRIIAALPRIDLSVKAKAKSTALKLKWKKIRFGKGKVSGYRVQICRNKKFKGGTLQTFNTAGTSMTIRNLAAGKTYYVRIRACRKVGVKTFCSKWSAKKKVRIP